LAVGLPGDRLTLRAIRQVLASVINAGINDPQALDGLAADKGLPAWAREMAISMARLDVQRPEHLVDAVLADLQRVLSTDS
jgi:hypothetical protein